MNLLDYLDWRGDIPFDVKPFNDIDNLILSELAYVNMDNLIPSDFTFDISLSRLLAMYRVARQDQHGAFNDPLPVLEKAAYCDRYKDIRLGGYLHIFDDENIIQIAAVTFQLDNETVYVAFRGTDHRLTGWREDFNFGLLSETPGQREAAAYLTRAARITGSRCYVGGHSKGGNFAVYAAAFSPEDIKNEALISVYSNDGPGFKQSVVDSPEYTSILDRIIKIVPEGSVIGMMLFGKEKMKIIKSDGKGMNQHSPYTWLVNKDSFVPAEDLTYASTVMDIALDRWVESLDDEQRSIFISSLFDAMDSAGFTTLNEVMSNKFAAYNAISKASKSLDPENRKIVSEALKKLASISKDVLWDDAKRKFRRKKGS